MIMVLLVLPPLPADIQANSYGNSDRHNCANDIPLRIHLKRIAGAFVHTIGIEGEISKLDVVSFSAVAILCIRMQARLPPQATSKPDRSERD